MEHIWWERVPNALMFTENVIDSLLCEKSVIIQYSDALPWKPVFLDIVNSAVQREKGTKSIRTIEDTDNPGEYLFQTFCKASLRVLYRPSKSYARFLAENDDITLHDHYLCIEIQSEKSLIMWETFVADYLKGRPKGKDRAVFVLLWNGRRPNTTQKGFRLHSFDDAVSGFDRIVFSTLAVSSVKTTFRIKAYLTELAANLLGNDIELCANCLQDWEAFLEDPIRRIDEVQKNAARSDGSGFDFKLDAFETGRRIWLSQIRSVYPMIEEYREDFVARHRKVIADALPIESSFGEICADPQDVELGTLVFMTGCGKLYLEQGEYKSLLRFKEARNRLSHLSALSYGEIRELHL